MSVIVLQHRVSVPTVVTPAKYVKETCTKTGAIVTLYIYRIRDYTGNAVNSQRQATSYSVLHGAGDVEALFPSGQAEHLDLPLLLLQ